MTHLGDGSEMPMTDVVAAVVADSGIAVVVAAVDRAVVAVAAAAAAG